MTEILTGPAACAALADHADFIDRGGPPFSSTAHWLSAAAAMLPGEPVVVMVERPLNRPLPPAALGAFAVTRKLGVPSISMLGGEYGDYTQFYTDGPDAAGELAAAVAGWLRRQRVWSMDLEQLPIGDPTAAALAALLPGASIEPGPVMPRIEGLANGYVISRSRRRQGQKAFNRMEADGRTSVRVTVRDPQELERWLPEVVGVRRGRDHGVGRRSQLDDPGTRAFYERIVMDRIGAGRAELNLVLIDGVIGGYAIVMIDGEVHRLFDGRVAHDLLRYRGGTVADLMAVTNASEAPGIETFDWLRGESTAKFGTAELRREGLHAASHRFLTSVTDRCVALKSNLKQALPDHVVRRLVSR